MNSTLSEEKIISGFQRGERQSIEALFKQFYSPLCYFATRLVNDAQEAEDITLESFHKLWMRRSAFESITNIKAFLYITTRNACYNFINYRNRQTEKQKQANYVLGNDAEEPAIDYDLIRAEVMQEIYEQVEILPPKCKEVFLAIFVEGLSTREIADRMQTSAKTVLNQKQKAVKLIRQELLKRKLFSTLLMLDILLQHRLGVLS